MTSVTYDDLTAAAAETAVAGGKLALEMLQSERTINIKGFRDLVTDADLASQSLITEQLRARFPTHGFVTEEKDSRLPQSGEILWVIDPIDGTTNYSRRQPNFCISIAALDTRLGWSYDAVCAGAIYDPARDELFTAVRGKGSLLNGRPLQVSTTNDLRDGVIAFDWSRHRETRRSVRDIIDPLSERTGWLRALGTAAMAMAWVAAGRYDLYLNFHLHVWDLAAAALLVREAGGQVSGVDGTPVAWSNAGVSAVVSNGRVHDATLRIIQEHGPGAAP